MIEHYVHKKIQHKMWSSFFYGAPYGRITVFVIVDCATFYGDDAFSDRWHDFRSNNIYYSIIDISTDGLELVTSLDANYSSTLRCSNIHYDFCYCILNLYNTLLLRNNTIYRDNDGIPCSLFTTTISSSEPKWWENIEFHNNFEIYEI